MPLTRDFKQTVMERVRREPAFARALLDEAGSLFLNGDPATARVVLRDLVNATVGFEGLAAATERPSKSCIAGCPPRATRAWTTWPPSSMCCAGTCRWTSKFAPPDQNKLNRLGSPPA